MDLTRLQRVWNSLGETEPFWAVITESSSLSTSADFKNERFYQSGVDEIKAVSDYLTSLGLTLQGKRALDFGCGVGRLTQALAPYFDRVDGVDIAASMVETARQHNVHGDQCVYHVNTADNLAIFPEAAFDFIYSNITLQHMEPQYALKYVQEFLRLLKPGGIALFQIPCHRKSLSGKVKQLIRRTLPQPLYTLYVDLKFRLSGLSDSLSLMEMYGIPQKEVTAWITGNGGSLIGRQEDAYAGSDWVSFRYCVVKLPAGVN
ncbi:MAG TPA: class I SAM-dependent methyltransferase [Trichocoleus sp.]